MKNTNEVLYIFYTMSLNSVSILYWQHFLFEWVTFQVSNSQMLQVVTVSAQL